MGYLTIFCEHTRFDHIDIKQVEGNMVRTISNSKCDRCVEYTIGKISASMGYAHHRIDGPAYIDIDDMNITFSIYDEHYYDTKQFCKAAGMSDEETFMWLLKFGDELPLTIDGFYGEGWESMSLEDF